MDLRQLNALLAVADHGSFSAAARALHTVQSNVSTHVARLETRAGRHPDRPQHGRAHRGGRGRGGPGPAHPGRARGAWRRTWPSLDDEVAGTVRRRRHRHHRAVARAPPRRGHGRSAPRRCGWSSSTQRRRRSLLQLTTGRLDLAVINLPIDDPDVATERLFDEDRLLVVPRGHPLYDREHLTLTDLAGEPLLLEPKGTAFRDQLDRQCADAGIELESQAEVDGMRLLATLAFQGFGAALLPASAAPSGSAATGSACRSTG